MEIIIAATGVLISILGGGCGAIFTLIRLSVKLDNRFDKTDRMIRDIAHQSELQRAKDIARLEMIEHRINHHIEAAEHKFKRLENALWQQSKFLEKTHGWQPRATFPLNIEDDD